MTTQRHQNAKLHKGNNFVLSPLWFSDFVLKTILLFTNKKAAAQICTAAEIYKN
jgi:hypothetical protein